MDFKANDRFEVKENGLTGTIHAVSFNSIYQETEYYVTWDSFPEKGQCCYMATDADDMWQKLNDLTKALEAGQYNIDTDASPGRGYVNQDGHTFTFTIPGGYTLVGMDLAHPPKQEKKDCDHKWIEVGFMHTKIVCKHCDVEQK